MREGDSSLALFAAFFVLCAVVFAVASGKATQLWKSLMDTHQLTALPQPMPQPQPQAQAPLQAKPKPRAQACEGGEIKGGFCVLK